MSVLAVPNLLCLAVQWDASEGNGSVPASTSAPEQATANANAGSDGDAEIDDAMPAQASIASEAKTNKT